MSETGTIPTIQVRQEDCELLVRLFTNIYDQMPMTPRDRDLLNRHIEKLAGFVPKRK